MNTIKYNAFKKEFPFFEQTMTKKNGEQRNPKHCDSISVKRITKELLKQSPREYSWDGSLVGIDEWERVHFVLNDGTVILDAVNPGGESGSNYAHSETHTWEGETVLEAIYSMMENDGINPEWIEYIVWVSGGYNVVEHYSEPNWCATIYKMAKGFTIAQEIECAEKEATEEVKAESNF